MYKIGAIGCGGRLRGVINRVIQQSDQIKVTSVSDPCEKSIEKSKEMFGDDIKVYDDYRDLCSSSDVDWVFVGSWNCYHREHVVAAFENGKDVFCEKPLATTLEDCLAMREAEKKSGRKCIIGFTLRYSAFYQRVKELIDSGKIGYVTSMEFNETLAFNHGGYIHGDWRRKTEYAGSHILEKCCHDIDLVNWILDSKPARVASFAGLDFFIPENKNRSEELGEDSNGKPAYMTWPGLVNENPFTADKDIIDNQVAIIEYENGVRSAFHTNCNCAIPERRMYICGSEGTIRGDVIDGKIELSKIGFDETIEVIDPGVKGGHGGGDPILASKIADSIINDTPPATTIEDGLKSSIACFSIDEAVRTGKVIHCNFNV